MDRIIVVNTHKLMSADQLNTMRKRVAEQLPAQGFHVIVVPEFVTVQEIGLAPSVERVENYDAAETQTEVGAAGTEVQHAEGNPQDEPIRYVWLVREETTDQQRAQAVGIDDVSKPPRWAVEVDQLSPQERVRYADRVQVMG